LAIAINRKWNHFYARQRRGALDTADRLNILLETGRDAFGLENGTISRIAKGRYTIEYSTVSAWLDLQFPIFYSYCDITLKVNDILAIDHMSHSPFISHDGHKLFKMESYIGIPIWVDGYLHGTLAFTSAAPRSELFNARDKTFLRGMARSAEHILGCN
jgi:GAF domain-containing protein